MKLLTFFQQKKKLSMYLPYFKTYRVDTPCYLELYLVKTPFLTKIQWWFSYLSTIRYVMFVCVKVLWPSQPNGVMSSAVSLPNHTFTGQA